MENFIVKAGLAQTLDSEITSHVKNITLQNDSTFILQGEELTLTSLRIESGARICGSGKITINESLRLGADSVIDLSEIDLFIDIPAKSTSKPVIRVGAGSTLILRDYPITGGENTPTLKFETANESATIAFQAPCRQVFKNIKVEGKVLTEEAYPEWFADSNTTDWAESINSAFDITENGIVKLQSQLYTVSTTIYVPPRGQLLGTASGQWHTDKIGPGFENLIGTVILINKDPSFDAGCVVLVNYNKKNVDNLIKDNSTLDNVSLYHKLRNPESDKEKPLYQSAYVSPGGKIANIYFANKNYDYDDGLAKDLCCILVSGTMAFDQLEFMQFRNCIVWANKYADQREVTRCYFKHDRHQDIENTTNPEHYLLDFTNVGDALVCRGNHFNSESSMGARFLRIHQCFGGTIADNIINGDVDISSCKGLDFTGNHLENGAQLTITSSVVNLSNNYFEKGLRPNIVIKSDINMKASVINLTNNSFFYYSANRPILENGTWTYDNISEICDYDLVFKGIVKKGSNQYYEHGPIATVNISNSMRFGGKYVGDTYPMGIKIGKCYEPEGGPADDYDEAIVQIRNFNQRSQIYSMQSTLLMCQNLLISAPCVTLKGLQNSFTPQGLYLTDNINWFGELNCKYKY